MRKLGDLNKYQKATLNAVLILIFFAGMTAMLFLSSLLNFPATHVYVGHGTIFGSSGSPPTIFDPNYEYTMVIGNQTFSFSMQKPYSGIVLGGGDCNIIIEGKTLLHLWCTNFNNSPYS